MPRRRRGNLPQWVALMGPARRVTALSDLSSLIVLYFLGDTLNTMTLGGLALAIGILVDHSTVTIENTHRLSTEEGQRCRRQLRTLRRHRRAHPGVAISCVFTSVVFLDGGVTIDDARAAL